MNEADDLRDRLYEIRGRIKQLDNKIDVCCRWHDYAQICKLTRTREHLRRVAEQYEKMLYADSALVSSWNL